MRTHRTPRANVGTVLALIAVVFLIATTAGAYPSLYEARCVSCHSDDTPSCDGCHEHHGNVTALVDQAEYEPGAIVTVTLDGGSRGGWVRGVLYDHDGTEVARATGPTGTGDDGAGDAVTFPVTLQAAAPAEPGQYTWEAAWFGSVTSGGGNHTEDGDLVTITVASASAVPDEDEPVATWGRIKALYR